jgi:4-carboxymuconolactone decarboxylase
MTDRLRVLRPSELAPEQRQLYAEITGGPRAQGRQLFPLTNAEGGLHGPFNAMLYAPGVGQALQGLGSALRYRSELSPRVREMAILAVAAHWDSDFERYAHEAVGRASGVSESELEALRDGQWPALADPTERVALDVVRALVDRADLDDGEYAVALARLSPATLVELSTLVGYYATLAMQLRIFRVAVPK